MFFLFFWGIASFYLFPVLVLILYVDQCETDKHHTAVVTVFIFLMCLICPLCFYILHCKHKHCSTMLPKEKSSSKQCMVGRSINRPLTHNETKYKPLRLVWNDLIRSRLRLFCWWTYKVFPVSLQELLTVGTRALVDETFPCANQVHARILKVQGNQEERWEISCCFKAHLYS